MFSHQQTKLGEGYVFTGVCDSVHRGGGVIPACLAGLQGVGGYPSMTCRFRGPNPRGSLRGLAREGLQAHTGGSPGSHPGGLQAHTQGVYPNMH